MSVDLALAYDELFATGGAVDPAPLYARAREEAPVFWSEATDAWVLTRYQDVRALLKEDDRFGVLQRGAGASIHGRTVLQMRGDEHRRKNAIIARALRNPRQLDGPIRDEVEATSRRLLDAVGPDPVDFRAAYTTPFPLSVITWMLDVSEAGRFRGWYEALGLAGVENVTNDPELRRNGLAALAQLHALITPLIEARRSAPGTDLISILATATVEGERLSDSELRTFVGFLLTAGVETTDRALASLMMELAFNHDEWDRLLADPTLATAAAAEILRLHPPVQGLPRQVLTDTEIAGVRLRAGDRVIGMIASANRDESLFLEPDRFDAGRFADVAEREFTPAGITLPFGAGRHHCTGSLLARLELETAILHLVERYSVIKAAGAIVPRGVMLRSPRTVPVSLMPRRKGS